jgi:REP element-mobilizing transposase RayT
MSTYYRRNLPHIEKDGASYFVSFSTRWEFVLPEEARTQVFNHCLFENDRKIHMHAFVVMPTHVHLLFTPLENDRGEAYSLAEIMHGIKGASSHSVNKLLGKRGHCGSQSRLIEFRALTQILNIGCSTLLKIQSRRVWREVRMTIAGAGGNQRSRGRLRSRTLLKQANPLKSPKSTEGDWASRERLSAIFTRFFRVHSDCG